ncbi:unnamed protein product [Lactuca virosa]|uniref:Uncharacterized protein n=1 Tax=Lactuca virosa TaxID=75947 RepID=A0AAU9NBB7_9ASTR|nr:unnamed protein product [Lactuca virosa]
MEELYHNYKNAVNFFLGLALLFERGLAYDGTDYLSFSLWDKYIEYEYQLHKWSNLAMIYTRILEIPNQQLDRYFNSFRELAASRPLSELRTAEEHEAAARAKGEFKNQESEGYMVLVEGEDEQSSLSSVCFLLPMLCQITMEIDGCRLIASSGAYKAVVECLIRLVEEDGGTVEQNGPIFLACDTILNLLLKREEIGVHMDDSYFIKLLGVLSSWAEDDVDWNINKPMQILFK